MRSIWKGFVRFSLVTIPIRIYNAVNSDESIRFNQLHKEDHGAIGYEKKCKKCGKTLTSDGARGFSPLLPWALPLPTNRRPQS